VIQLLSKKKTSACLLLTISISGVTCGCATKGPRSMFPFGSTEAVSAVPSATSTSAGLTTQLKSMGTTMTSAVGKARDAVTSTFSMKPGETVDPETSLAHMPKSLGPEIWVTQGQLAEMKGNHSSALDFYSKALEQEPANVPALQSVARLYMKQGQITDSIQFYEKTIAVQPSADNYAELSEAQRKANRLVDAQASIQKAISIDPSATRYRNSLASILVTVGRSDEAVTQLEQVLPPAVANYNVAYLHFSNKNFAAAQQHLQTALNADPNLQPARDLMATISKGQAVQTTMATLSTAENVFRTAQGAAGSAVTVSQVPYQTPSAASMQPAAVQPSGWQNLPPLPNQ
jgi:Tfp pilus assembly protein PilF